MLVVRAISDVGLNRLVMRDTYDEEASLASDEQCCVQVLAGYCCQYPNHGSCCSLGVTPLPASPGS